MELTGSHRIPAPREVVWAGLCDPEVLRASVPGCEGVERSADGLKGKVAAKIGPVKALFDGEVKVHEQLRPESCVLSGQAAAGGAGFAKGGAKIALTEDGDVTVATYTITAEVGGKVGQLGSRLVGGVARQQLEAFFEAFSREIVARPPSAETVVPSVSEAPPIAHEEPDERDAAPQTLEAPPLASGVAAFAPPPAQLAPQPAETKPETAKEPREPVSAGASVGRILLVAAVVIAIGIAVYHFVIAAPPPPV
ncbi:CoxG family protein [Methylopila turkensis]|nr:carbon monoxide dehydrogenase subunit G [Methylopila turkensis]